MAGGKLVVRTPHLGRRIQVARQALRPEMTQDDLARALGVQANNVSRIERGLVRPPSKAYPILQRVLGKPRDYFVDEPLDGRVLERDDALAGVPNLRALMGTSDWRDLSEGAKREVLDEANRSGGDLLAEEWMAEIRRARRRHPAQPTTVTRDAVGRQAEEDVVDDPDDDKGA